MLTATATATATVTATATAPAARRRARGDDGTTLAELVVCMALTTVVGAMALSFFVWTGGSSRATAANSFTNQTARTVMTTAAGLLRLSTPGSITPGAATAGVTTAVTFTAADNAVATCPRRPAATLTLTVASGALTLARTGPVSAATASQPCAWRNNVASNRTLATGVKAGTGFAFTYPVVNNVVSTDSTKITAVGVTLVIAGPGGRTQTFTSTAVVSGVGS